MKNWFWKCFRIYVGVVLHNLLIHQISFHSLNHTKTFFYHICNKLQWLVCIAIMWDGDILLKNIFECCCLLTRYTTGRWTGMQCMQDLLGQYFQIVQFCFDAQRIGQRTSMLKMATVAWRLKASQIYNRVSGNGSIGPNGASNRQWRHKTICS